MTFAFLDLDSFKEVNDTHGHEAGDAVLVETADRLRRSKRGSDVVARVGGDEFVIMLDAHAEGVATFVDRLRRDLEQPIAVPDGSTVSVGASIGVATAQAGLDSLAALLDEADAAMYSVKRARRAAHAD